MPFAPFVASLLLPKRWSPKTRSPNESSRRFNLQNGDTPALLPPSWAGRLGKREAFPNAFSEGSPRE